MRVQTAPCVAAILTCLSAAVLADAPSNRIDPCVVVTSADVQKEFGTAFAAPHAADDGLFRHCSYADASGGLYVYVDSSEGDESQLRNPLFAKVWAPGPADLGVPAHVNRSTHELRIFKKDVVVTIRLGNHHKEFSEADQVAHEVKLARLALGRM